jgi:hypothetical protein
MLSTNQRIVFPLAECCQVLKVFEETVVIVYSCRMMQTLFENIIILLLYGIQRDYQSGVDILIVWLT